MRCSFAFYSYRAILRQGARRADSIRCARNSLSDALRATKQWAPIGGRRASSSLDAMNSQREMQRGVRGEFQEAQNAFATILRLSSEACC